MKDKLIYLHFFVAGFDWYIADYYGDDLFAVMLFLIIENAGWGYISFSELKKIKVSGWLEVDCELKEN